MKKAAVVAAVLMLAALDITSAGPTAEDVAIAYAPVIRQKVSNDQDYLASFNFDRNWNAYDNWERQEWGFMLKGTVYYSVVETESHWFVTYLTFHPRRWGFFNNSAWSQENQLEGAQLVVEKNGEPVGRPLLVETFDGSDFRRYQASGSVRSLGGQFHDAVAFEGSHPILKIANKGHKLRASTPKETIVNKGEVVYRYTGKAEEPKKGQTTAGYALVRIVDSFWARRDRVGKGKTYGASVETPYGVVGAALGGDNYKANAARMPWTWRADDAETLHDSDWLFDPAYAFSQRYEGDREFSSVYVNHPYASEQGSPEVRARQSSKFQALYASMD